MADPFLTRDLPDEAATAALARGIAACLQEGDVVALRGDLGAGKTTFARALIRALTGDPTLEVPSPTFTLVQTYQTPRLSVAHVDLYRIRDPHEIEDAGLLDAATDVTLIEWPERAGGLLPADHLEVALEIAGKGRKARLAGGPSWRERLRQLRATSAVAT